MTEVIQFNYLHRDSGNWKKFGCKKFSNPEKLSIEVIEKKIRQNLIDGAFFYPEKVGIKKFKFHRFCDDYSWYEFESIEVIQNFQKRKPKLTICQFCALLEKMNALEVYIMGDQPTTCPICGTRTEISKESNNIQLHHCPSDKCQFNFLLEDIKNRRPTK